MWVRFPKKKEREGRKKLVRRLILDTEEVKKVGKVLHDITSKGSICKRP